MFRNPDAIHKRINEIAEKFRQKGAISPERALTIQELGLPPRFEQAMHRRLGQTGIFVEVNGKYYLNEERLKQIQERRTNSVSGGYEGYSQRSSNWFRYAGILLMLPIGIIVLVVLYFFFMNTGTGYYPGEFLIIALIVLLVVFIFRMLFWRSRRRYWRQNKQNGYS